MPNYQSQFLVATPALGDPNFRQSVVLILQGNDDEAFGVVINRESDKNISEIWETVFDKTCDNAQPLYLGGPVFGPIIAIHTESAIADDEIMPGLYYSTQKDAIVQLVEEKRMPFRLFVGGAGWGKNQLAQEIEQGAWFMVSPQIGDIFDDPTEIWKKILARAGRGFLRSMLHTQSLPEDPSVN